MKTALSLTLILAAAPLAAQTATDSLFKDALPVQQGAAGVQVLEADTHAAVPLLLTREPGGGSTVAHIGAGEALQVVLTDGHGHYLLKNAFGLTGWAQSAANAPTGQPAALKTRTLTLDGEVAYTIRYHPALGKESDKKQTDPEDSDVILHDLLITPFAAGGKAHIVRCAAGVPNDFTYCTFPQDDADKAPVMLTGNHFVIPGDGYIYSDYHDRGASYYRHYSKWQWADGNVSEVEQPYRYIGIDGTATGALVLTARADGGGVVGSVAKGEKVRVLLADPHQACPQEHLVAEAAICDSATILIKNEKGQSGWVTIRYEEGSDNPPPTIDSKEMGGLVG